MRLDLASVKAIRYACLNFHYAKAVPVNTMGFNVFNAKNEWCGVILYGSGANNHIGSQFNLSQGQCIELVRVALNGKQESTSKALAISLILLKKYAPACKLVVSYADKDQDHIGTIYQATNWYYVGTVGIGSIGSFIVNGKKTHPKSIHSKGVKQSLPEIRRKLDPNATIFRTRGKIKYLYPIDKSLKKMCEEMAKPYLKKESDKVDSNAISS